MDDFTGKKAVAAIAHQREDYPIQALTDYRDASRPSTHVAAMNEAAAGLSDEDIELGRRFGRGRRFNRTSSGLQMSFYTFERARPARTQ